MQELWEDRMSVNPHRICFYAQYTGERFRNAIVKTKGKAAYDRINTLSAKSANRLRNAINTLVYTATYKTVWVKKKNYYFRYKVNFITLTLPSRQIHTDEEIVRTCLSPFLEAWSKRRPGLLYVWKAEVQDNGNIHFHITANAFYHYKKLRSTWNRYVEKLGYVTRSGIQDPNSTDVHSVQQIRNIAAYLVSYATKKDNYTRVLKRYHRRFAKQHACREQTACEIPKNYFVHIKRKVTCRIWSCSALLKKTSVTLDPHAPDIRQEVGMLMHPDVPRVQYDYCTNIYLENDVLEALPNLHNKYLEAFRPVVEMQQKVQQRDEI